MPSIERSTGSQALLGDAFDGIPLAIVVISGDGAIAMVNQQTERLFGYTRDELMGNGVEMLIPTRFRHAHPGFRTGFFQSPDARPMGMGRDLFALHKDGSEFPVEIGLNPITTEHGPMVLSAIVDVTERRRQEELFRKVVESAPNAMVMVSQQGRIVMVNAQAEKMFGYRREELLDHPVEMLIPGDLRPAHPAFRNGFFASPHARPMGAGRDLRARRKDGSEFPVEIGLNPIQTADGPMVLSAVVDITERKQREESTRQALREKELLLGEIHHRVKNNLQIIHSLMDLQAMGTENEDMRSMLLDSQNRVRSMSLIHQTLYQSQDFARVDFQHFLDTLLPFLMESYTSIASHVEHHVDAHGVSLSINAAIPCGLIINELVANALKHAFSQSDRGHIWIDLTELPGGEIRLNVSNDGAPIPPNIDFEAAGTLGVQLVKLLTEQLHGTMAVQRAAPTRFTIQFTP